MKNVESNIPLICLVLALISACSSNPVSTGIGLAAEKSRCLELAKQFVTFPSSNLPDAAIYQIGSGDQYINALLTTNLTQKRRAIADAQHVGKYIDRCIGLYEGKKPGFWDEYRAIRNGGGEIRMAADGSVIKDNYSQMRTLQDNFIGRLNVSLINAQRELEAVENSAAKEATAYRAVAANTPMPQEPKTVGQIISRNTPDHACTRDNKSYSFDDCLNDFINNGDDPYDGLPNYQTIISELGTLCSHGNKEACDRAKSFVTERSYAETRIAKLTKTKEHTDAVATSAHAKSKQHEAAMNKRGCFALSSKIVQKISSGNYEIVGLNGEHALLKTVRTEFDSAGWVPSGIYITKIGTQSAIGSDGFQHRFTVFVECQ